MPPAPMPWNARKTASIGIDAAKAPRAEPMRNTAIATRNSGLRPREFNTVGAQEGFEVGVAGQRTSVYSLRSSCTTSV